MKSSFRRSLFLLAAFLISSSTLLAQCGVERESVRTGTDTDADAAGKSSSPVLFHLQARLRRVSLPIRLSAGQAAI